jgi:amino acid adenylation domain-containing protein
MPALTPQKVAAYPAPPLWFHTLGAVDPNTTAIESAAETLTYAQLGRRADAVHAALGAQRLDPGSVIAVAMGRTPELIVTLLGILRAGHAYLPLDPAHPSERLRYILENAGAALVVGDPEVTAPLAARVPVMTAKALEAAGEGLAVPADAADADGLAYVIYTSGSTGRPKGVEIGRPALANFLTSMRREPGIAATDRVLAHTTIGFDISALEIWGTLTAGGCVVLVDAGTAADARQLAQIIDHSGVTIVQATPTSWSLLLAAGFRDGTSIKALAGGEPLSRDLATRILDTGADLWNMYGPTETTVWSTISHVARGGSVSIGFPIDATTLRVLDAKGSAVSAGSIGELYIGGAGVARGYRNQPSLTAERFVTVREGAASERMFRTGDLVRVLSDGSLECLGRIDDQLKIDGFRIEPGEIEAVLRCIPGVGRAAVTAREQKPGDRRLVAYIVAAGAPPAVSELRREASARLPAYMVPSVFTFVPSLPLTPGGKLDRKALPAPDWTGRAVDLPYEGPQSETERAVLDVWRDVLGIDRIGRHDDFFAIGGRSRLAAQVFARIAERYGTVLPLAAFLSTPTIAELARMLDGERAEEDPAATLIPINPWNGGPVLPIFCIHPLGGHALTYRDLARRLGPEVPFYGLQASGFDGRSRPLDSVEAMAARYLDEIRKVQPQGPYVLGGFSFGGLVAFEMARRLLQYGEQVRLLVLLDSQCPDTVRSRVARILAKVPVAGPRAFAALRNGRRHLRRLRRLGLAGYAAERAARLHRGPEDEATAAFFRDEGGPLAGGDAFSASARRVIAANARAQGRFIPQKYPGRMLFFRASGVNRPDDSRHLWNLVTARLEVIDVPAGHSSIRMDPHVGLIADRLRGELLAASV